MKYNIRLYCIRMSIASLAGAGVFGVLREIVPVSPEMVGNSLIVFIGLGVLATVLFNEMFKLYADMIISQFLVGRKAYEDEDHRKLCHRAETIKTIANRNMKTGETSKGLPVKEHIVVPYEDMLRIWDIADHMKWG